MKRHIREIQYLPTNKMESLFLSPKLWLGPNSNSLHLLLIWQLSVSGPFLPPVYSRHGVYRALENWHAPPPPSNPISVMSPLSDRLCKRHFINVWHYILLFTHMHIHTHIFRKRERSEHGNVLAAATLCLQVEIRGAAIICVEIKWSN